MSRTDLRAIRNIGLETERVAGKAAAAAVMAGSASLTERSSKAVVTGFVSSALGRMAEELPRAACAAVMRSCGHACAAQHASMAEGARKRFAAAASLDEFLAEETRRSGGGVRYGRRGRTILHTYEPRSFRRPMRCFCGLARGLKADEELPATYCECSAGFVEATWETILGGPVTVKLLESAVSGGTVCRFEVTPLKARLA